MYCRGELEQTPDSIEKRLGMPQNYEKENYEFTLTSTNLNLLTNPFQQYVNEGLPLLFQENIPGFP